MKGFNFPTASTLARTVPRAARGIWTCRQCLQSTGSKIGNQTRGYAKRSNTSGNTSFKSTKSKRRVYVAAAGGALGVTALTFTDDLNHAYGAAERTGRVVSTLFVCINE